MRLREINPAPFAAYMNCGAVKLASSSPERFLSINEHGETETKPIKGTRPRLENKAKDRDQITALKTNEKERAENIMITDLLRNDLSKCCTLDSINVPHLCEVESFASVHHLVSTITGKLEEEKDAIDLLRACFPGGSITGAPKIRAMEIIEELEPHRRGAYCGSIAAIGFNGTLSSNILIRTLLYEAGRVSLQVGGGITAKSDPDAEYEETIDKARAIFDSFISETDIQKKAV
jgi:para-aminobenzoate synthetase component 1